jgi:hypothetical protein
VAKVGFGGSGDMVSFLLLLVLGWWWCCGV